MHAAKLVPIFRMVGKIGQRFALAVLANLGQLASVLTTFLGELRIDRFSLDQQFGNRTAQWWRLTRIGSSAQEHPATLAPPFGQPCVAQYADMARNTWLALAKHLRHLADGQLHRAEQAHDTQARRVGESAEDQFGSHYPSGYKDIFISVNHLPQ